MADRGKKQLISPVDKYIEYNGVDGQFEWYNKGTKEREVFPITSAVLITDERFTVSGYSEQHKQGIFSNEVSSNEDHLHVRIFQKQGKPITLAEGTYPEVKDKAKAAGAKFTKCIYFVQDGLLVHAKMGGCAFGGATHCERPNEQSKGGWIAFNTKDFMTRRFAIVDTVTGRNSPKLSEYKAPIFSFTDDIPDEDIPDIEAHYEKLKKYLAGHDSGDAANTEPTKATSEPELTDTSNWPSFEIRPGVDLGECSFGDLEAYKANFEVDKDYGTAYDMVCAAIMHHQQQAKAEAQNNQQQAQAAAANPNDALTPNQWREYTMPSGKNKMGDLNLEQLKEGLAWVNQDSTPAEFKGMAVFFETAIAELDKPQETEKPAGMPALF